MYDLAKSDKGLGDGGDTDGFGLFTCKFWKSGVRLTPFGQNASFVDGRWGTQRDTSNISSTHGNSTCKVILV